jgi:hypothetical protein
MAPAKTRVFNLLYTRYMLLSLVTDPPLWEYPISNIPIPETQHIQWLIAQNVIAKEAHYFLWRRMWNAYTDTAMPVLMVVAERIGRQGLVCADTPH